MRKRFKIGRRHSRKLFRKHSRVHRRNGHSSPMRGGIRF